MDKTQRSNYNSIWISGQLSTTHALLAVIALTFENINVNLFAVLILDLAKAFDTVSHDILLFTLDHYRIFETVKDPLQSFLKRKKFVFVNGFKFSIKNNNYSIKRKVQPLAL